MAGPEKDLEVLRARFLKAYASVPLNLRNEIVAMVEGQTISWAAAYVEVAGKTKKGDEILFHLAESGVLEI